MPYLYAIFSREAAAEAVREIIAAAVGWEQWIAERLICRGARSRGGVEEACAALRADTAALARVLRSLAQFVASLPEVPNHHPSPNPSHHPPSHAHRQTIISASV